MDFRLPCPFILFSCFWDRVSCSVHSVVQTNWKGIHCGAQLGLKFTTIFLFLLFKFWDCSHEPPQPTFLPACCPPASLSPPILPFLPPLLLSLFSCFLPSSFYLLPHLPFTAARIPHQEVGIGVFCVEHHKSLPHACFMHLDLTSTCRDAREFIRPFFSFMGVDKPSLFCYCWLCWGISVVWPWVTVKLSKSSELLYSISCQAAGCGSHQQRGRMASKCHCHQGVSFPQRLQHLASSNCGPIWCLKMAFLSMSPTLEPSDCIPSHCRNLHGDFS